MSITSLINRRSLTTDPAEYEALVEACWFWEERADDLANDPAEIPSMVASHLAEVAEYIIEITDDTDLAEGEDDDPALTSAKQIAANTPHSQWDAIASALEALATELGG